MKQRCDKKCIQNKGKNTVFDTVFLRYFQIEQNYKPKKGQEKLNSLDLLTINLLTIILPHQSHTPNKLLTIR